jgi:hypothetical protein
MLPFELLIAGAQKPQLALVAVVLLALAAAALLLAAQAAVFIPWLILRMPCTLIAAGLTTLVITVRVRIAIILPCAGSLFRSCWCALG